MAEGTRLWSPSPARRERANITHYMKWLQDTRGLAFRDYDGLWNWSVSDLDGFWGSIWEYFNVRSSRPGSHVLTNERMPGAEWFAGARLNYAEHALRRRDEHPAILFQQEGGELKSLSYQALHDNVAAAAAGLRRMGVGPGDRVVAYVPNTPETVIAFLAVASLGAVWSSCAPEFGTQSVVDRFQQLEPTLFLAVDAYSYNGKLYDRRDAVREIKESLPSLTGCVMMPGSDLGEWRLEGAVTWTELTREHEPLTFAQVPFDHPLWILFSSGTTGLPKAIVHGHGGMLLEHLKALSLHLDLGPDDHFFWQTTTGWMMWNFLVGGLLLGATILLYEGSPALDGMNALWRFADTARATYFGTSAPFIEACMKRGVTPGATFDLSPLRGVGSTGAPLTPEGFRWVYEYVHPDVVLGSLSGGTDVCTAFVLPCPTLPVHAGEIQCRGLGARVESFDESGLHRVGAVGELVVTRPLPSMPVGFWNDPEGTRYSESYFETYPGVWRHGDWIKVTERGSCVIYGRSDSTLNRSGIRTGTSEYYRVVERIPGIVDSLVIDTGSLGRTGRLLLFVVLDGTRALDEAFRRHIGDQLRREISPRHVPDEIVAVEAVPRTLNGKKLEVPIRRLFLGASVDEVVNEGAVANPAALQLFAELARERSA